MSTTPVDRGSAAASILSLLPELGPRVRAIRSGRGLGQKDLARELTTVRNRLVPESQRRPISHRIIQRVEEGDYRPLRDPAIRIALSRALDVPEDVLFPDSGLSLQEWRGVENHMRAIVQAMEGAEADTATARVAQTLRKSRKRVTKSS